MNEEVMCLLPSNAFSGYCFCLQFSCVEGEIDHIGAIAELEACSYIIFVYTSKICHHPYLRPPTQATASAIECQPIVSQALYDDYLTQLETQKIDEEVGKLNEAELEQLGNGCSELIIKLGYLFFHVLACSLTCFTCFI